MKTKTISKASQLNATPDQLKGMASVLKTIKQGKIYVKVLSVSNSGMSRRIAFYRALPGGRIENITAIVGWLRGTIKPGEYKQGNKWLNENGLMVGGCGMDMIFHTLYCCMRYDEAKNWNQRYSIL
jgi:hypothetical protein